MILALSYFFILSLVTWNVVNHLIKAATMALIGNFSKDSITFSSIMSDKYMSEPVSQSTILWLNVSEVVIATFVLLLLLRRWSKIIRPSISYLFQDTSPRSKSLDYSNKRHNSSSTIYSLSTYEKVSLIVSRSVPASFTGSMALPSVVYLFGWILTALTAIFAFITNSGVALPLIAMFALFMPFIFFAAVICFFIAEIISLGH